MIVFANAPVAQAEEIFPEKNFFEPNKPRSTETLLNINERKRRAEIKMTAHEKFLHAKTSAWGQLQMEIKQEPLKSHQEKLTRFSAKIKKLHRQLQNEKGVARTVFLELGNTYLESHKYLNSLSAEDQGKLTEHAVHSGTILGSHESALWVFRLSLFRYPNDGETHFLLGKVLSAMGKRNLALRRARNAKVLFNKHIQPDQAVKAQSFIEALKNASPEK